jgi:hypothetical protein
MKAVKTYEDFLKEPLSPEKQEAPKQAVSEKCWEALKECYEMAKKEMKAYHENENKEEVAENYMTEFAKCNEAMLDELTKECEGIMAGPVQPGQA